MSNLRFAVVGLGNMGRHHAKYLAAGDVAGAELSAVCDNAASGRDWAKQELPAGLPCYESTDELFARAELDAVLIATPHYDHPPIAEAAFAKGLHVLTEKPAGVYTKHVRAMNEAAAKSGKVFGIMFQQRTLPVYQKLRELMGSGELGELQRFNWIITSWFRTQHYYNSGGWRASWAGEGGGVLLNQCPHNLDLWQWITGMPVRVQAFCGFGKRHQIEVEDEVTAYVEYENGATGVFITTTGEAPGTNRLELIGDRGKIICEHDKLQFWRTRTSVKDFCANHPVSFASPETWVCDVPTPGQSSGHVDITRDFVKSIQEGSDLLAPGSDGIKGLELSNAMLLSAWTGQCIELPVDDDLYYAELQKRIAKQ